MVRKEMWIGQLTVIGLGLNARVYKVIETAACDQWGTLSKGGRYVAVRAWDVEKGEFKEGALRTGYKPSDLRSYDEWLTYQCLREDKVVEKAKKHGAEAMAVHEFFEGLGAPELVRLDKEPIRGGEVVVGWRIESYPRLDSWHKVMVELGVIEGGTDDNKEDS